MQTLLTNIRQLYQVRDKSVTILKGADLKKIPSLQNAYLLIKDGWIASFGVMNELHISDTEYQTIDCSERIVLPAFCDSHTHLVFAATREEEFVNKINGMSYEEIAAKGGGILNSAKKLNDTAEEVLLESALERLEKIRLQGTGAVEIKSGYGLTVEGEIKMLRVIRKLRELSPISIKSSFLGAHAVPDEYKNNRNGYIRLLIEEMLPLISDEKLADYCDVFCDKGFFTPDETDTILKAAAKYNLKPKIHANQLANSGGVQVGIKNNAVSVDHLENIGDDEISALKESSTIPTLLPSAAFFLRMDYPPARKMADAGLPVTLATDYNPGSSPSGRMSFVISLSCIQMKLTPEEAINAATLNGAAAMDLQNELGSITIGKRANLIICNKGVTLAGIPYSFGNDCIESVLINGKYN